jgi:hypothetical protein
MQTADRLRQSGECARLQRASFLDLTIAQRMVTARGAIYTGIISEEDKKDNGSLGGWGY